MDKVVDRYLSEVNRCGEECLRLCSVNFGNVCTEGCRREWNDCKGIPQDQFGWIPKLNAWKGVSREPSHPGNALRELVKLIVTLEVRIWCRCLMFVIEMVYWLVDSILMYCVDWERVNLLFHEW